MTKPGASSAQSLHRVLLVDAERALGVHDVARVLQRRRARRPARPCARARRRCRTARRRRAAARALSSRPGGRADRAHRPEQDIRHGGHASEPPPRLPAPAARSPALVGLGVAWCRDGRRLDLGAARRSPWRRRRRSRPARPARSCGSSRSGVAVEARRSRPRLVELVLGQHARAPRAARGRARRGRARRPSACAVRPAARRSAKSGVAVVVQVLEILGGPAVGAAPARRGGPGDGAPADLDGADVRPLAAHEADRAGGAGAHRDALQRDALEVDLDGREAVLAVEEAGRRQAGARPQRLDEAVQPRAQHADQPLRLVELLRAPWPCTRGPEARPMRERA